MKLEGLIKITCNLKVLTGLHIGGETGGVRIGATDKPVIKGADGKPYIPGSSLKGKIRSLLELAEGLEIDEQLGRHECGAKEKREAREKGTKEVKVKACDLCTVFGRGGEYKLDEGPTRVIFRDCYINEDLSSDEAKKRNYTEIKWENAINRITSRVDVGLRDTERVLPGTVFNVEITYRVFDEDLNGKKLDEIKSLKDLPEPLKNRLGLVIKGMKLLEKDYLGGCGTRGYGKVKFENIGIRIFTLEHIAKSEGPVEVFKGDLEAVKIE
ncbi:type III-A CRISPR-associated RAMP protein Csm3 [Archaeoglobus sp.]